MEKAGTRDGNPSWVLLYLLRQSGFHEMTGEGVDGASTGFDTRGRAGKADGCG